MRRENRTSALIEDISAREAGYERIREVNDRSYRTRKSEYLRGRMTYADMLAGESHSQWYSRWCDAARPAD